MMYKHRRMSKDVQTRKRVNMKRVVCIRFCANNADIDFVKPIPPLPDLPLASVCERLPGSLLVFTCCQVPGFLSHLFERPCIPNVPPPCPAG